MGLPQGQRVAFVKKKADQSNRLFTWATIWTAGGSNPIDITNMVVEHDGQRYELKSAVGTPGLGLGPRLMPVPVSRNRLACPRRPGYAARVQPRPRFC